MHYFIIENSINEWNSTINYIATSLSEAERHIMEFADWYCEKGSGTIREVDSYYRTIRRYQYRNGKRC